MTSDEIATQLVAHLNAATGKPVEFKAEKADTAAEAQAEVDGLRVFVVPFSEAETPFDQGNTCRRDRVVSIVVNGPIAEPFTKAKGMELSEWVREQLEGVAFGRYLWAGNETVSLYDVDAMKTKNQFLSLARASYYDLA